MVRSFFSLLLASTLASTSANGAPGDELPAEADANDVNNTSHVDGANEVEAHEPANFLGISFSGSTSLARCYEVPDCSPPPSSPSRQGLGQSLNVRGSMPASLLGLSVSPGTDVRLHGLNLIGDPALVPRTFLAGASRTDVGSAAHESSSVAGFVELEPHGQTSATTLTTRIGNRERFGSFFHASRIAGPVSAAIAAESHDVNGDVTSPIVANVQIPRRPGLSGGAIASVTPSGAGFAIGHARASWHRYRTQVAVSAGTTRERTSQFQSSERPLALRHGARLSVLRMERLGLGLHDFTYTLEAYSDNTVSTSASLDWSLPRWGVQVDQGLRIERAAIADETTSVLLPRVGLKYDPTHVGLAKIRAHWGRYLRPDQTAANVAFASVGYHFEMVSIDAGVSHRDNRWGAETTLQGGSNHVTFRTRYRYERGTSPHYLESTLHLGLYKVACKHYVTLGALTRQGGDAHVLRGSGVAVTLELVEPPLGLRVELTQRDAQPNAALSLSWSP